MNDQRAQPPRFRAINPDGTFNLNAMHTGAHPLKDLYHFLITSSWPKFLLLIVCTWAGMNLLFTVLYLMGGDCIANAEPGNFFQTFFFSVQTLSTIGYGSMSPTTTYSHVVVSIEAFTGLLGVAIMTGLMFAKFSRPTARVLFTDRAVIARRDGVPCLMMRVGNARANEVVDARAKLYMAYSGYTDEGEPVRRFSNLKIERPETALFALTWTIVHRITEDSPLCHCNYDKLNDMRTEIILVISGLDATISQRITARRSYIPDEIVFDQRFEDMLIIGEGIVSADYDKFQGLVPNGGDPVFKN